MRQTSLNILRATHGFTLVEAMLAVAVLMVGVLALEKNFTAQIMNNNSTKLVTAGVASSSSFLETLRALPLNNAQLPNAAKAGEMEQGLLNNGANCANPNIDMNKTTDAGGNVVADFAANWDKRKGDWGKETDYFIFPRGQMLQPRGLFTIFWNVCNNPSAEGTMQIRMIIRWNDKNRASNVTDGDALNNQQVVMNYVRGNL